MNKVFIRGIGKYLPSQIRTNAEIEKMVDTTEEWILTRTGIRERRIAAKDESTSDLALHASKEAIEDAQISVDEIDVIIVATMSPDLQFPSTACILQRKLGAKNAAAFDVSAACAGFSYALTVATQFIKSGTYRHALVIGAEVLSRFTDWTDRSTCILFGDGAGAAVISSESKNGDAEIISEVLQSAGEYVDLLKTPGGGSQFPTSEETLKQGLHFIKMEGQEVFRVAVKSMVDVVKKVLEKNGLTVNDVDCLIPHQANLRIISAVGKGVGIDEERVFINVQKYGNMSSATTIVGLYEAVKEGVIKKGDNVVLVSFGGGFVWGGTLIKW